MMGTAQGGTQGQGGQTGRPHIPLAPPLPIPALTPLCPYLKQSFRITLLITRRYVASLMAYSCSNDSVFIFHGFEHSLIQLYEEEKMENEKLRRDVKKLQQDLSDTRLDLEKAKLRADHSVRSGSADSTSDRRVPKPLRNSTPLYSCLMCLILHVNFF